jgi:hypothetical protein
LQFLRIVRNFLASDTVAQDGLPMLQMFSIYKKLCQYKGDGNASKENDGLLEDGLADVVRRHS